MTGDAGILQLMEDLGNALTVNQDLLMLGGGNPGQVPEVEDVIRKRLLEIAEASESLHSFVGIYDPPQGNLELIRTLADYFHNRCGWDIRPENICLTNGSQSAFFMLFNLLAGPMPDGSVKQIQFPLTPEYIGYTDTGIHPGLFTSSKPLIEELESNLFKYHVDFENFKVADSAAALCVSRPTNPTGNVLTDDEIHTLDEMARSRHIPLIIDNAYGLPFPSLIYREAELFWNENTILCMSLSKLGLPSVRTGIVIGPPEITKALASMNAIMALAPGGIGARLAGDLIRSGEIDRLSNNSIRPFYQKKAEAAVDFLSRAMQGVPFHIHKPEGSMFLWLWLPGVPIDSERLYQRLKQKGVLVVSGHYFFPGLDSDWPHKHECIRISYSQDDETVHKGLEMIAEEVMAVCRGVR